MAKKRFKRKDLKQPDEFISQSSKLLELVLLHKTKIAASVGGIVGLVLIASVIGYFSAKAENEGSLMLTRLMAQFQMLEKSSGPQQAYEKTREQFQALLKDYAGRDCGKIAALAYANICFRAGELESAIAYYSRARDDFEAASMLNDIAVRGLGYAYEESGQPEKAVPLFEVLVKADTLMADEVLFSLARLYGLLDQNDKRTETLNRLSEKYPDSIYHDIAQDKAAG